MEENTKLIESLIERATEYGKTSIELVKLNAVDKTSDMVSSFIPHTVVFVFIASFMIFFNLGLAFWIGEILGTVYFGFFVVASFYIVSGMVVHFFLHKRFKKYIYNAIIKQLLN